MQSYQSQVNTLKDQLNEARVALAKDISAAVKTKDWPFLRDRHNVAALVEQIDEESPA